MQWPWNKAESDLDREVQHHLEKLADAYERQGLSRREALRQARAEFGGVDKTKEECRDIRWWSWLMQLRQDLGFAWRMMRKTRAITMAAVISLALGIGATTSILSLADALLWRTLAVPEPQQLSEVLWDSASSPNNLMTSSSGSSYTDGPVRVSNFFSTASFEAMRDRAEGKAQVAAYFDADQTSVSLNDTVVVANLRGVSSDFFAMLSLRPFAGRLLGARDDDPAETATIVISHRFWSQRLGADTKVLGRTLRINNLPYTIVGILPAEFRGIEPGDQSDIYCVIERSPDLVAPDSWLRPRIPDPQVWWVHPLVRRAQGVTEGELQGLLDAGFAAGWATSPASPETTPHVRLSDASRGLGSVRRSFGDPVWILLSLTTLVLAVACANIANLLLAQAVSRRKEIALRVSLGCGRRRLVRQLLTESLLLAVLGGVLSIPVTALAGQLIGNLTGLDLALETDLRTLAGAALLTFLAAGLFGVYPAWQATRIQSAPALKEGTAASGGEGRTRWSAGKTLVLAQVSLGLLLTSAAILFAGHLRQIVEQDAGFERGHILLFEVLPGEIGYEKDRLRQFYVELEQLLSGTPGVETAGLSLTRPMRGGGWYDDVVNSSENSEGTSAAIHHASASFLEALGVPLASGRAATWQEEVGGAKTAVISEDLVQRLGLESPLGTSITSGGQRYQVVGVARQAHYARLTESPSVVYLPFDYERRSATVVLRTSVAPLAVLGAVREAVADLDRNLPLVDVYTMEQQISRTLQRERLFAWLCGSFGVLALVLCVVGLYGLMSHTTARRTSEMGIRRALGATRQNVMLQVFRDAMILAGAGMALGVPLAVYGAHWVESLELLPAGEWSYANLAKALAVVTVSAIFAALAPAARAASVEPMEALRRG
jgi:predicted permease